MSRKYKFLNPEVVFFIPFAVESWVDVFTRNEYKNILIENLAYCQKNHPTFKAISPYLQKEVNDRIYQYSNFPHLKKNL